LALWSKLDPADRQIVDGVLLGDVDSVLRDRVARSRQVLDADPNALLVGAEDSWAAIGNAIAQYQRLLISRHELSDHSFAHIIDRLQRDPTTALATVSWLEAVNKAPIDVTLRSRLRAIGAAAVRTRLSMAANRANDALLQVISDTGTIESEFGVTGISVEHPAKLKAIVGQLSAKRDELTQFLSVRSARASGEARGLTAFLAQADNLNIATNALPGLFSGLVAQ
jgi:malate synthase